MRVKIEKKHELAVLPTYESVGAAGCDLYACTKGRGVPQYLQQGHYAAIPTGIAIELPPGYEAQIRPRSGLAVKHGVSIPNTPGTIDSDYRGELSVVLINFGPRAFYIEHGMRIAQMVIAPVQQVEWDEVTGLGETVRGAGGFGSTGQ